MRIAATALDGLKAKDPTTTGRPTLLLLFLPRFWGSHENRWENGKTHLVPVVDQGWNEGRRTLCGFAYGESESSGELEPGQPVPPRICQKCRQVALRRGYGCSE